MSGTKTPKTNAELIDYRFNQVDKKLDSIEKKMDGFQFAKQSDFDALELRVSAVEKSQTVTEQKLKPIEKIYYLVLGLIVSGIIGLGFYLVQKAFE